jgi:hypothetical protein
MIILLITLVLLQFALANLGSHQLHQGNAAEEAKNHPHLQLSAKGQPGGAQAVDIDLCLDCQCHGGHVTLPPGQASESISAPCAAPERIEPGYLPPESLPSYRPPILNA